MATGVTAGMKRSRADMPVYASHLSAKRWRHTKPLPCDVNALLRSDGASAFKVEQRARALDALGIYANNDDVIGRLSGIVGNALLALIDLNAAAPAVAAVLNDVHSVVRLNIRSHAYCMGSKHHVGNTFLDTHKDAIGGSVQESIFKLVLNSIFAQENSVAVRVLSGGGVRDVLLADWCRQYKFCTNHQHTPNLVIITAEGGRTFLIPFSS